jgi:hypothetical protein
MKIFHQVLSFTNDSCRAFLSHDTPYYLLCFGTFASRSNQIRALFEISNGTCNASTDNELCDPANANCSVFISCNANDEVVGLFRLPVVDNLDSYCYWLPSLINITARLVAGNLSHLANCSSLRVLDLSRSYQLQGTMPVIENWPFLEHFDLSFCGRLVGTIPTFANCTSLVYLDLSGNRLSATMPQFASRLLKHLNLRGLTLLDGTIPNLASLEYLDLSDSYSYLGTIPTFTNCSLKYFAISRSVILISGMCLPVFFFFFFFF